MELSVIICSHNPRRNYLNRVLAALRDQTLSKDQWELLVIDNASREPLDLFYDLSWHPHARHLRENELGLAHARQLGIREFTTDLIVFVDDDNVLDPDYLSNAVKIKHEWPLLGVWGSGRLVPEFESEPPEYLREFLPSLALREVSMPRWVNIAPTLEVAVAAAPWGAGQCLRADIAKAYYQADQQAAIHISSHRGDTPFGGDDVEICYVASSLGFGMGIFPMLGVTHLIPKERVSENYLLKLREFSAATTMVQEYKWQGTVPYNPFSFFGMLTVIKHLLMNRGIHRRMHLANVRATIRARGMIKASQGPRLYRNRYLQDSYQPRNQA